MTAQEITLSRALLAGSREPTPPTDITSSLSVPTDAQARRDSAIASLGPSPPSNDYDAYRAYNIARNKIDVEFCDLANTTNTFAPCNHGRNSRSKTTKRKRRNSPSSSEPSSGSSSSECSSSSEDGEREKSARAIASPLDTFTPSGSTDKRRGRTSLATRQTSREDQGPSSKRSKGSSSGRSHTADPSADPSSGPAVQTPVPSGVRSNPSILTSHLSPSPSPPSPSLPSPSPPSPLLLDGLVGEGSPPHALTPPSAPTMHPDPQDGQAAQTLPSDAATNTAGIVVAAKRPLFVTDRIDELLAMSTDPDWRALLVNWVDFEVLVSLKNLKVCVIKSALFSMLLTLLLHVDRHLSFQRAAR